MISQTKAWPGWIRDEQKYQVGFRKRLEGERKAVSGLGDVLVLVLMCSVCWSSLEWCFRNTHRGGWARVSVNSLLDFLLAVSSSC